MQVRLGVVHVAGQSFMDMNGHINNVAYLGWALDALPDVIFEEFKLEEVNVVWHTQAPIIASWSHRNDSRFMILEEFPIDLCYLQGSAFGVCRGGKKSMNEKTLAEYASTASHYQ